jgi:putative endopeptidase
MTPQKVNAYYNAPLNEIVLPAALLQPPLFNINAEDAVNYGGIGGVIGHEIGHDFDGSLLMGLGYCYKQNNQLEKTQFTREMATVLIRAIESSRDRITEKPYKVISVNDEYLLMEKNN